MQTFASPAPCSAQTYAPPGPGACLGQGPERPTSAAEQSALIQARRDCQGLFLSVQPELWWSPSIRSYAIVIPFPPAGDIPAAALRLPHQVRGVPVVPLVMPPAAIEGRGATLTNGLGQFMSQRGTDAFGGKVLTISGRGKGVVAGRPPVRRVNVAGGGGGTYWPPGGMPRVGPAAPGTFPDNAGWAQPPATLLSCYPAQQLVGSFHSMQPLVDGYDPLSRVCTAATCSRQR